MTCNFFSTMSIAFVTLSRPSYMFKPLRRIDDDDEDIPVSMRINSDISRKLNHFFLPFTDVLSIISGVNLTYWYRQSTPDRPKVATFNENMSATAHPTEWYELDDGKDELVQKLSWRAQLVSALLPKKTSQDSGYNTTIGMLTMF